MSEREHDEEKERQENERVLEDIEQRNTIGRPARTVRRSTDDPKCGTWHRERFDDD